MFGMKLKELRKEKGLSQKDVAQKLGCTQAMICFWENGIHEPTESVIRNAAKLFDVSADYLLGLED